MISVLLTCSLPPLLGYGLFVGISGRLDPVSRPRHLVDRPSWALGLWVAAATALVLGAGLHLAYGASPERARALLAPGAWSLAALLLPGLVAGYLYRGSIAQRLGDEARRRREISMREPMWLDVDAGTPASGERSFDETLAEDDDGAPIDAPGGRPLPETETIVDDADDEEPAPCPEDSPLVAAFLDRTGPGPIEVPDIPVATADERESDRRALAPLSAAEEPLRTELDAERGRREETEKHLRVTRRALAQLESESRRRAGERAGTLIALEEELESRIRECATAEARATRESARRLEAESEIVALREDVLAARRDARRGTEARAKALATATRSVAIARQAVRARARAEERLRESEGVIANRQETISSLIRALEKEKRRTREEVGSMARQLMLHERQLDARRRLEEVARNVEGKLTSRLARKIARARPVTSSN